MTQATDGRLTQAELDGFTSSENVYKHWLGRSFLYTDGVMHLAERAGAHWLIDAIASHQTKKLMRDPMLCDYQIWKLVVKADKTAVLTCQADTNTPCAVRQRIPYTDFPLEAIKLTVERGGNLDEAGNVVPHLMLMLPSER